MSQNIWIGKTGTLSRTFSAEDVSAFSKLSLDVNPVHLDADYAAKTVFQKPIVHGMLYASLISAVLANDVPGQGTVYLEQSLQFLKPVFIGDTISAEITVIEAIKPHVLRCKTVCKNQNYITVVDGHAVVSIPKSKACSTQ